MKHDKLLPCAYCGGTGKLANYKCPVQFITVYKVACSKECDSRSVTFAVKHKDCAMELWNAAYTNIMRNKAKK
jgi:hypothetical protein